MLQEETDMELPGKACAVAEWENGKGPSQRPSSSTIKRTRMEKKLANEHNQEDTKSCSEPKALEP